jgi:hypothetical protein
MGKFGKYLLFLMLLIAPLGRAAAQTTPVLPSQDYKPHEFPLWARDLRRAEIVAFGSFPFTVLLGTFVVETITFINHDWDARYRPWPFKSAGGVAMSRDDRILALEMAALGSVIISLADFIIVRYKRNQAERAARNLPDGSPIIIRRPWPESAGDAGGGGGASGGDSAGADGAPGEAGALSPASPEEAP